MTGGGTEVRRHSLLPQNPKLSEVFTPRPSRALKPSDKDKAYQRHSLAQDIDGSPLFPPRFPANYQKLWPNRVSVGAEELVKHMSNVPSYLQRIEKGDDLQEKALNFGVLDWRRLERWTDNHRRATVSDNATDSPATSNASSPLLTLGSSSKSCRGSDSSYLTRRKQSLSLNHHQDSSPVKNHTHISEAASIISKDRGYHLPQIASRKCAARHISGSTERCQCKDSLVAKYESTEQCQNMDNLAAKYGECKRKVSDSILGSVGPSPVGCTLPSRSKNCGISSPVVEKVKPLVLRSDFGKMSRDVDHVCYNTSSCTAAGCPQDHHCGPFQIGDGMSEHFEESIQGDQRFSIVSTMSCILPTESGHTSVVGASPSEEFLFLRLYPNVPHSGPLPIDVNRSEWSAVNAFGSDHCEESVPCDSVKSPKHSNVVATLRSSDSHEKHVECASKLQVSSAFETPEKLRQNGTKTFTTGGGSLPNNQSNAVPIRSSSLKESSGTKQAKWVSLSGQNGDVEADISKSRRSPLRRLLDPLLKPKAFNRSQAAGLTATSPRHSLHERLASNHGPQSSSHVTTNCSDGAAVKGFTPSSCMPVENPDSVYDEKHESFPKQALLQLSWKNGLPLFTFSVNESDILAATWKKGTSSKEDCECIYTFYYVREIKKKFGGWISQGNKGKRKELSSSVVGQMKVSCLRCPKNHFAMREFILFGPRLKPTAHETLDPVPNSELAAVVLRVPEGSTESCFGNMPHSNESRDLLKRNRDTNKHDSSLSRNQGNGQLLENNVPKMVAILPSEVHGLSDRGKPATLIERWKSGGLCDCGGWDVGCSLTILTNNVQDSRSGGVQSCYTVEATHRVELFTQGGGQERRPVFCLDAFKEGLYAVDFHPSIAVLQAFTVCVAILHARKPRSLHELQDSMQDSRLCPSAKQAKSSMSMPYQPPVSPVGRA